MPKLRVVETFTSIQGESTRAGLTCFFIRLSGCDLRCSYCDTPQALETNAGRDMEIAGLVRKAATSGSTLVEITGGEPLLQPAFALLARRLRDEVRRPVLVETNGSLDISAIPARVVAIMDVKCPSSAMSHLTDMGNLDRLRPYDEVKFVIGGISDYRWARDLVRKHKLTQRCKAVLFSPVSEKLKPGRLACWIMKDRLPVRFQLQLHKVLGLR